MVAFPPIPPRGAQDKADEEHSALHCTPDRRRCAQLNRDAGARIWTLAVFDRLPGGRTAVPIARYTMPNEDETATLSIWPRMVFVGGGGREMYGVTSTRSRGFSGGGASATTLSLGIFDAGKRSDMVEVARVPGGFSAMIRACFGERDMKRRAGACHDEYAFAVKLTLDPPVQSGIPRFAYTTRARTFPGRLSRTSDSLSNPPLRRKDLVWAPDRACSYRRILAFDPKLGRYAFDIPPPECEDYQEM